MHSVGAGREMLDAIVVYYPNLVQGWSDNLLLPHVVSSILATCELHNR